MSGAASRRKGNRWELDVCRLLVEAGWHAVTSRSGRGGTQHGADIVTDAPVAIEAKNQQRLDLAGWLDQAITQAAQVGLPAAVFIKRRQKPAHEGYVLMRADQYLEMLNRTVR